MKGENKYALKRIQLVESGEIVELFLFIIIIISQLKVVSN